MYEWLSRNRFLFLLVSLLLLAVLHPIVEGLGFIRTRILLSIFFSIILFSSIYAISRTKRLFVITLLLAVPSFGLNWAINFFGYTGLSVAAHSFSILFLLVVAGTILSYVLRDETVTGEKISAAICVYLLIGLIWADAFLLTHELQAGSFQIEDADLSHFVYYSYITLSTLGYGDITPLSPPARALSYVEAITGQVYLTVLVARLVGLHIAYARKE
jgi:hypothetical protein